MNISSGKNDDSLVLNKVWNPETLAWEAMTQSDITIGELTVSGVAVTNFPETQTIDGDVTATVDGTVDIGNWPATQTINGTVSIDSMPPISTTGLSDDELRASPVEVYITNTDEQETGEEVIEDLRVQVKGAPVKVSGETGLPFPQREDGVLRVDDMTLNQVFGERRLTNLQDRLMVETRNEDKSYIAKLQTAQQEYSVDCSGMGGATIQLSGTFTGTITFECTSDGGNWVAINGQATNGVAAISSATAVGIFRFNVTGLSRIRCRCSAAMSGVATVSIRISSASYANLIASTTLTAGSAAIGSIVAGTASIGAVTEATLDPTVRPIIKQWTVAPTAPALQASYPHPNSSRYPQIQPRIRTEIGGDQQLPLRQQENTLELKVVNDIEYRMLEKIWLQLALFNQNMASQHGMPLPAGWETIQ